MSIEMGIETRTLQKCPYWKKWIEYGGSALALCGVESMNEYRQDREERGLLLDCPYLDNAMRIAMDEPSILEIDLTGSRIVPIMIRHQSQLPGKLGINQLEQVWDQEVEKFIQRHSK